MNNINLKNIAESLIDTFYQGGKIAKDISQQGVKVKIKTISNRWSKTNWRLSKTKD